jgi:hypothetical protein
MRKEIGMNTSTEATKATETSLTRDWVNLARYYIGQYLGGRRGLIILTVAALGIGLALNWSWLVAIGVAPLLISLAPCAVMCALGLCMSRMGGKSCSPQSSSARQDADARSSLPALSAEAQSEPVGVLPSQKADARADRRVADDEGQAPTRAGSRTTAEGS